MKLPKQNALLYYVSYASIPVLGLIQTRLLTTFLDQADYGTIQLVVPLLGICFAVGGLGTGNFALRFFARDGMRVVKEALLLAVSGSLLVVAGLSLILSGTEALFGVALTPLLLLSLLAAVLVKQVLASIKVQFRSTPRHIAYNAVVVAERGFWVLGAVLGVVLIATSPPVAFLSGGAAASAILILALSPLWLRHLAPATTALSAKRLREILVYGAPVVAVLLASDLLVSGSRYVIVAAGMGPGDVARYAVGYSLATLGMQATYEPLITYAHPRIFRAWEEGRPDEAQSMLRRLGGVYLVTGLAVGIVFWLAESWLLVLVADTSYRLPSGTFPFLLAACFLTGVYRFLATRLLLKANTVELLLCFVAALAVNLGGGIVLIAPFGLRGVGAATMAGSALLCMLVWWRGRSIAAAMPSEA